MAIIGMACRFPGATSPEEYWDILSSAQITSSAPPIDRIKLTPFLDARVKANFLSCPIDSFDASFFNMSPSEACLTDPQARLLLETSWEAFEDAGINPDGLRGSSVGVFHGSWLQDYKELINLGRQSNSDLLRKYVGNGFGVSGSKLSYFYGFTGPNLVTESGCSSSMVGLDLACKSLQRHECPLAIVSGTNIILQVDSKQRVVWAEDGLSKPFDATAHGYGRAEGVAVLLLKRYSDAVADNDRIHGIVRASFVCQEGFSSSFGTPTVQSEVMAMKGALSVANLDPSEVDYLEAHATGTSIGDPIEAAAIAEAYKSSKHVTRWKPLFIGSGKGNIGHTESCSGLAGVIKVLLAMKHETIPAHVNCPALNPRVDFTPIPGEISFNNVKWPVRKDSPRIAGISSFGITGTYVHCIVQEPPTRITKKYPTSIGKYPQLLTLSAKSPVALNKMRHLMAEHLKTISEPEQLENSAFTLNAARAHHKFRNAFVIKSTENIENLIKQLERKDMVINQKVYDDKPVNICFTFPGVSRASMLAALELYKLSPVFRKWMDNCNKVWVEVSSLSNFAEFFDNRDTIKLQDFEGDNRPEYYAAALGVQYSLVKLWESWGILAHAVMGHCMGEIAAAIVAQALSLEDGFRVVLIALGWFHDSHKDNPGRMVTINLDGDKATRLIQEFMELDRLFVTKERWLEVAATNSTNQSVISGEKDVVSLFQGFCEKEGHKCFLLPIHYALHSRAVELPDKGRFLFSGIQFRPTKLPYFSSVTGTLLAPGTVLTSQYWYDTFRQPINFYGACKRASSEGQKIFLEIGLGNILTSFASNSFSTFSIDKVPMCLASLPMKEEGWLGLISTLGKLYESQVNIDWKGFYRFESRKRVALPGYPFQRRSFWFTKNALKRECPQIEKLHPLLGTPLSNATGYKIFENKVSPTEKSLSYIYDHRIGTQVIFPGAAFLEMILSAGYNNKQLDRLSTSHLNWSFLCVDKFDISRPLHLGDDCSFGLSSLVITQTIGSPTDSKDDVITIYSKTTNEENELWRKHASGKFTIISPLSKDLKKYYQTPPDFSEMKNITPQSTDQFYQQLAAAGPNLGRTFQSIKHFYTTQSETLIEVELSSHTDVDQYILHPVLIDAMFQACILHTRNNSNKNCLRVPVHIEKFVCSTLSIDKRKSNFIVYCKDGNTRLTVYLLTEEGVPIATMITPQLVTTTVASLLQAAGLFHPDKTKEETSLKKSQNDDIPNMFRIVWKPARNHKNLKGDAINADMPNVHHQRTNWMFILDGLDTSPFMMLLKEKLENFGKNVDTYSITNFSNLISQAEPMKSFTNDCLHHSDKPTLDGILISLDESLSVVTIILTLLLAFSKCFFTMPRKSLPKLHLITRNTWSHSGCSSDENTEIRSAPAYAAVWGFMRCLRSELPSLSSKSIDLHDFDIDNVRNPVQLVWKEIMGDDNESEVLFCNGVRHMRRVENFDLTPTLKTLTIPDSVGFKVELPETNVLSDLTFTSKSRQDNLAEHELEVEIKFCSLNFRDVFSVLKPSREFDKLSTLGMDFSGVIIRIGSSTATNLSVGDMVCGVCWKDSTVASHLVVATSCVMRIPNAMTFQEAATLPLAYLTAWECLVTVANLKAGQVILIHAASGGVGIAATQVAKYLGVEVIGTAGCAKKRRFLRSYLEIQHVFNSRSPDFADKIMKITGGRGVNMVLNCLTGPGFKEASLQVCQDGGHFVEISKMDIWAHKEVSMIRPNIAYTIVDIAKMDGYQVQGAFNTLSGLFKSGVLKPLPYTSFTVDNLSEGLSYLQKAKQIGKVVIELPTKTYSVEKGYFIHYQLFNDQSAYLITGGKGAIGLALAQWMVSEGARFLILVGRSPPSSEVCEAIQEMEKYGAKVFDRECNVGLLSDCQSLFKTLQDNPSIPPLRGIHHCAGVLSDKLIQNQDWSSFEEVLRPKINGAYNLHRLSLGCPLEFFILHSSMSSIFGIPGQSNYGAGNCYMDSLIEMRRGMGLPGMVINWGQWDIGMAAEMKLSWTRSFTTEQGIQALHKLFRENKECSGLLVGHIQRPGIIKIHPSYTSTLFKNISQIPTQDISKPIRQQNSKLFEKVHNYDFQEKRCQVRMYLITLLCETLGISEAEVDDNTPFSRIGLDSLLSIEFNNKLMAQVGNHDGYIDFSAYGTVDKLTNRIMSLL